MIPANQKIYQSYSVVAKLNIFSFLLFLVFIFSFSFAIFQYLDLPIFLPKTGAIICAISAFLISIWARINSGYDSFKIKYFWPHFCYLVVGSISYIVNDVSFSAYLLFLRDVLPFYLLFLAVINVNTKSYTTLNMLLIALFLLQLPVSWIKLLTIGMNEHWIGTVHINAGELSLLLP